MKILNAIKKVGIVCGLLLFSVSAFAAETAGSSTATGPDFFVFVKRILVDDLGPLLGMTTTIAYFLGLALILGGMTRLYRHGSGTQNMMHRTSPMSTAMYFVAGTVLVSFMPHLHMLSNSIFANAQTVFMQSCNGHAPNDYLHNDYAYSHLLGAPTFTTDSNNFCPMEAYSLNVDAAAKSGQVGEAIKYVLFGVLFLVGVISFIRGMVQLVKLSEGGQGQGVGRALTHIFAGVVAVNADSFYNLMNGILQGNAAS